MAKNGAVRIKILILFLVGLFVICLFTGCQNYLGVYTLDTYKNNWKDYIGLSPDLDPYQDFWKVMTSGPDKPYADPDHSRRFLNSEVTVKSIIPVTGGSVKSWDDFDFVFFYGHNNTIVPPHPHDKFHYFNYEGGTWVYKEGYLDEIGWGYTTNYDYYAVRPINNANLHPGAVTYLYNEYTSSLLGGGYDYGGGTKWRLYWNDPLQTATYGKLGDKYLKWLILYGCQAVITANEDGSYNPLAFNIFTKVHGNFHIVMGHYKSYYTSQLKPLSGFANDLLIGVPIQTAYFDTDPDHNTSAIAAEKPLDLWEKLTSELTGGYDWSDSTMVNDRWDKAMADNPGTDTFTMRWILPYGGVASDWK